MTADIAGDAARLRKLLRDARKLAKRMERTVRSAPSEPCWCRVPAPPKDPEPPAPRWLLSGSQLQTIAKRLDLTVAGTYAETGKALGIEGDLYAMIDETWRAARRLGMCRVGPGSSDDKGQWLFSYLDAKHAYSWHLAVANDRASLPISQRSNDG